MNRFWLASLAMLCLALVGCKDSGGRVTVTGTVTFDGKPLETGNISFGGSQGAAGTSAISNGKFSLNETGDEEGVLPGKYDVLISSWIEERGSVLPDGSFSPGKTRIPLIYLDPKKSALTAEVKSGEKNQFTFELKSDAGKSAAAAKK